MTAPADEQDVLEPQEGNFKAAAIAFSVLLFAMFFFVACAGFFYKSRAPSAEPETELRREEKRRRRKEWIAKNLVVREWVPEDDDAATVESIKSFGGNSIDEEDEESRMDTVQLDDVLLCKLGTDDVVDSFMEQEPGCAICLSKYKIHQQVCESNNMSCLHVFHSDCMSSWLLKHNECPMCRERYLLKTV